MAEAGSTKSSSSLSSVTQTVTDNLGQLWAHSKGALSEIDGRSAALYACAGVGSAAATAALLFFADVQRHKQAKQPLNLKPGFNGQRVPKNERMSSKDPIKKPLRRRLVLSKKEVQLPSEIDFIVIGSGMGGLSSAAVLARCGYTVVVLEAHDRLGGCCHVFSKKFQWETGIHYVGRIDKYGRWLDTLGSPDFPVEWEEMGSESDGFAYDRYVLGEGEDQFEFFNRKGKRMDDLKAAFPSKEDHIAIDNLQKYGEESMLTLGISFMARYLPSWLGFLLFKLGAWKFPGTWAKSMDDVLSEICAHNPKLRLCLTGCVGDIGGKQAHNAFGMLWGVLSHYDKKGAFFPKGGPTKIVESLVATIDEFGGTCLANASVEQILIDEDIGRAIGVRVRAGKTKTEEEIAEEGDRNVIDIPARLGVISAAGLMNTYKMVKISRMGIPASFCRGMRKVVPTVCQCCDSLDELNSQHFQVFIGFNKTSEELNLPQFNTWFLLSNSEQNWNYDKFVEDWHKDPLNAPVMAFVGFPSAKDSSYSERHPGLSNATIVTEIPFKYFEKWSQSKVDSRGQEYEALKQAIAKRLTDLLFQQWPQLEDCVEKITIGSPLSAAHYLHSVRGVSYGLPCTVQRYYDWEVSQVLKVRQPISNLYLSGQDITNPGFGGAFQSGLLCASDILGYNRLSVAVANRTVIRDLDSLYQK